MDLHNLIAEVKKRPELWDGTHPDHGNRSETQRGWQSVGEALGQNGELCRSKWKNLRCSYRRLQNRQNMLLATSMQPAASSSSHHHHNHHPPWPYAEAMSFLGHRRHRTSSSSSSNLIKGEGGDADGDYDDSMSEFKPETSPSLMMDTIESDNEALMQEFQSVATPLAMRQLSHNISLASAAAEEEILSPPSPPLPLPLPQSSSSLSSSQLTPTNNTIKRECIDSSSTTALAAASVDPCQCAKRVDEQVHFLESLEREEQQLMQSTTQDISRCRNVLHVGDSDYNFLVSFLPMMKQMSPLKNLTFRSKMAELLLETMASGPTDGQVQVTTSSTSD